MRTLSFVCFSALMFTSLASHAAADSASLQSKCQEQMAANQEGLAKVKQLAQLVGNDKTNDDLAKLDSGCERLGAEADGATQTAEQSKLSQAVSDVNSVKDQLKGLGSMFGK
ncbi:conserved exported hypothetical protein [Pseudomonas sp. 8Z]|uniref:hypothetical protein n=1 Tax=Pseudomonas sp. 8Z TaxID=2653166 RepID=UPI0012F1F7E9|nr:hypothetical protein [Pseudomonas sp. 8Z]VXC08935.1 conserved exported hypothetical protein [Pseudomonas sp. 8Z]